MRVDLLLCVAVYSRPKYVLPRKAQTCVTWSHTCLDKPKSNYVCVLPGQRADQFKAQNHLIFFEEKLTILRLKVKHLYFCLPQNK